LRVYPYDKDIPRYPILTFLLGLLLVFQALELLSQALVVEPLV
jgi:hypothetical protein